MRTTATPRPVPLRRLPHVELQKENLLKKSTVIRSDKPHAVKMTEGSNVAQRKSPAQKPDKVAEDEALVNIQQVAPVKTTKSKRLLTTETPAKPVKAAKAKPQVKAPTAVARSKDSTAKNNAHSQAGKPKRKPVTVKAPMPEVIEVPLWEQDNPIKARIEQLKARNAQLSEQIQRLPSSRSARGLEP